MTEKQRLNEITGNIIGAAIQVHRTLGPGLLESAYEACLAFELGKRGLRVQQQKPVPLIYEEVKLDCGYRADLIVEGFVVVEVKSVEALAPIHEAQVMSYLRLSGCKLALLINFNVCVLKDGIRRFINGRHLRLKKKSNTEDIEQRTNREDRGRGSTRRTQRKAHRANREEK